MEKSDIFDIIYILKKNKNMTRVEKFIEDNYGRLHEACMKMPCKDHLKEDLLHDAIMDFMSRPNADFMASNDGGIYYIVRIMIQNSTSKNSRFYYRYIKKSSLNCEINNLKLEDEPYDISIDTRCDKVEKLLKKLEWYDEQLFRLWIDNNYNVSKISKLTKIPRISITTTLKRVKMYLATNLEQSK